jgi:uncharacterized protein YqeY
MKIIAKHAKQLRESIVQFEKGNRLDLEEKEKEELLKKHEKKCLPGKVVNPKTGRCIKKPATKSTKKPVKKQTKKCPSGKVVNTKTGRCIKKPTKKVKRR